MSRGRKYPEGCVRLSVSLDARLHAEIAHLRNKSEYIAGLIKRDIEEQRLETEWERQAGEGDGDDGAAPGV